MRAYYGNESRSRPDRAAPHAKGIPVRHPRCATPPFATGGNFETVFTNPNNEFVQNDQRLPPQPNNTDVIADASSGTCGHSTFWSHDAGVFDRSDAQIETDRGAFVGAWFATGSATPTIWANFTSQPQAIVSDGNVRFLGKGGTAQVLVDLQLDIFTAGQPLGTPPWSTDVDTSVIDITNLDQRVVRDLPGGVTKQLAGVPSSTLGLQPGETILVLAGVVSRIVCSLNGTLITLSTQTTWQVTSICGWF